MGNYLGVDWGVSRVGLAFADKETKIALAYATLKNDSKLFDNLERIIKEKNIKMVIIGVPFHDKHQKIFQEKDFGGKIELLGDVSVEYQSEILTTKTAQRNLIEKGVKSVKNYDDKESARVILQDWLDKK